MEHDLLSSHLTHSVFPLLRLIRRVMLYSHLRSSAIQLGVYSPANKLALWRQCGRHWHILTQLSIEPKPALSLSTLCCWWHQSKLGLHVGGLTWQHSPTVYTYPHSAPLGSAWANLCSWRSCQHWLLSTCHAPWRLTFNRTTSLNTSGLYRALSPSPLGEWSVGVNQWRRVNSTASGLMVAKFSLTALIQWVIASRAVLPLLEHGNIFLYCNHQGIVGVAGYIYPYWDILLLDVVKGNIPKQRSKDCPLWDTTCHLFTYHAQCCDSMAMYEMSVSEWTSPDTLYRNKRIPKDISQKPITERTFSK